MKIEGGKRIETEVLHLVRRIFPKTNLCHLRHTRTRFHAKMAPC